MYYIGSGIAQQAKRRLSGLMLRTMHRMLVLGLFLRLGDEVLDAVHPG